MSVSSRAGEAQFLGRCLTELAEIEAGKLSRANRVDFALLDHRLRAGLWRLERLQEWAWNPLVYTRLSGSAIYGLMARDYAPLPTRLTHVAERLEQFPRLFEQIRAALQPARVPKIHAETALQQNRGVLNILDNMVKPHVDRLP